MCLNEKTIGYDRSKAAQRGNETELPEFFSKIEIKFDAAKIFLSVTDGEVALDWQFDRSEYDHNYRHKKETRHNSFP
jgi:hypothetical protein